MSEQDAVRRKARRAAAGATASEVEAGLQAGPVRVIVTPLSSHLVHPLSRRDIQRILSVLPADSTAGLRSVALLDTQLTEAGHLVLASYRRHGFIRLHAVPGRRWVTGPLPAGVIAELESYGARVAAGRTGLEVHWSPGDLRLFFAVGALLPAVARHRREREGTAEPDPVVRALGDSAAPWPVSPAALQRWREFLG